jgi:hypothetical protein
MLRLLASRGWRCSVADCLPLNLAGSSRFCHHYHRVSAPAAHPERFVQELATIVAAEQIELIIPTGPEVFCLSHWRHGLEKHCQLLAATSDLLTHLHSQYQVNLLLNKLGFSVPETCRVETLSQREKACRAFSESIMRPEFPRPQSQVYLDSATDIPEPTAASPWIVQRRLRGPAFNFWALAWSGQVRALAIADPLRAHGIHIPAIERTLVKWMQALSYSGHLSGTFIHQEGRYWLIETQLWLSPVFTLLDNTLVEALSPARQTVVPAPGARTAGVWRLDDLQPCWQYLRQQPVTRELEWSPYWS